VIHGTTLPVVAEMKNLGSRMDAIGFKLDAHAQINSEKAVNRRWIVGSVIALIALVPAHRRASASTEVLLILQSRGIRPDRGDGLSLR